MVGLLLAGLCGAAACGDEDETAGTSGGAGPNDPATCVMSCRADPCCEGYRCVADHTPQCGTCSSTVYTCVNGEWESEPSNCRPPCTCTAGETRPCSCPDGSTSSEECVSGGIDNFWADCACDGAGGAAGSSATGGAGGS